MALKEMKFDTLKTNYIKQISNIWHDGLGENLLSIIGKEILISYLKKFLVIKNNQGFLLKKNNKPIGFVLFGNETKITSYLFKKKFFYIVKSFLKNIFLLRLKNIFAFFSVILFLLRAKKSNQKYNKSVELLIIVIEEKYQGRGYGQRLVNYALKDKNYFTKFNKIFVKTVDTTKKKVNFYKKLNFKYKKKISNRIFLELKI